MIKLKFDKKNISNHFGYSKFIYLAAIVGALALVSFAYSTTRPRMPAENKVDIAMYCGYPDESEVAIWQESMLSLLPADQKQVNLASTVAGDDRIIEAVIARMSAREGDILVLDIDTMTGLTGNYAFAPLDSYIDRDAIEAANPDIDWSLYTFADDDGVEHIYMLPTDAVEGMYYLDMQPKGNCIAILSYSINKDNAAICMNYILSQTQYDGELTIE